MKSFKLIKNRLLYSIYAILIVLSFSITKSYGSEMITFGPEETEITGSIKYTVIGKYRSNFDQFKGEITFDSQTEKIESVYLEIEAQTIESSCKWCDKIVRSKQLLHTEKYPKIIFESNEIVKDDSGYSVKGTLDMHGVKKEVVFPFDAEITLDADAQQKLLTIGGKWLIKRKDFDIVWNRLLDKGGILVGNYITVDWGIKSLI